MGIETDLNVNPYFDDFDETKDFHRVLFKPAVPLQARELTTLQTILQNQVEKFGQFTFKEGSIVKGCTFTYNRDIEYVKILDKDSTGLDINVNLFGEGDYLVSSQNLVARVVTTAAGLETQNPDLNTLFFNYLNTGNAASSNTKFIKGEELKVISASSGVESITFSGIPSDLFVNNNDTISVTTNLSGSGFSGNVVTTDGTNQFSSVKIVANGTGFTADDLPRPTIVAANGGVFTNGTSSSNATYDFANAISNGDITFEVTLNKTGLVTVASSDFETDASNTEFNVTGKAFQMKVQDGVIFQKGTFQRFAEQDIIVSKYTNKPNELTVGVTTTESFVNSSVDTSLLDNASGFANENAPGADRLKLVPTLTVNTITNAVSSNNFLRLVEFQHGMPVKLNSSAALSGLGEVLERRLFETSGDYVVEPLSLGTEQNFSNTDQLAVAVGAGIGYNKGKRFELVNTSRINLPKATTTQTATNQELSINYGNYVEINEMIGEFGIENNDRVLIMGTALASITNQNDSESLSSNTGGGVSFTTANSTLEIGSTDSKIVGHARVRAIESASSDPNLRGSKYNLYLYDIQMNTGKSFEKHARAIFHYSKNEYTGTLSQVNVGDITGSTGPNTRRGIADLVLHNGKARLLDNSPEQKDLVFPLGQVGVKDITDNASFVYESVNSTAQFAATGIAELQLSGSENWNFGTSSSLTYLSEAQENELIMVSQQTVVEDTNRDSSFTSAASPVLSSVDTSGIEEGDYITVANSGSGTGIFQVLKKSATKLTVDRNVGLGECNSLKITYPEGKVISLKNRTTANAAVESSGQTLKINLGRTLASTMNFTLMYNRKETSSAGIVKNYKTSDVVIYATNNATTTSGPWCLGIPDGHKLVSVHRHTANVALADVATAISNGQMVDITKEFELDDGQQGAKYGLSSLKLKQGSTATIGTHDTLAVKFRHFDIASGSGFASFDSYSPLIETSGTNAETPSATKIATATVPIFTSQLSGRQFNLRDSIDFRPYVANTATKEGVFGSTATFNPSNTESISSTQKISSPNKIWTASIEYYLPRKDRLVIEDGALHIVRGIPSTSPELPHKPINAMQLGTLDVPVYPSLDAITAAGFGRPDLGVKIKMTQLKRYTMRDIKKIDQRVNNLEYYTSLNFLEKQSADQVIPSRANATINRFKNGFLVDNFASPTTGNPLNTEFKAGFDVARKHLTPRFEQYNIPFKFSAGSNIIRYGDVCTTNHSLRKIIEQPNATQSRRCTSAYWQYNGDLQLYPDYINHTDVTHNPEQQIQIDVDVAHGTLALLEELNKMMPIQSTSQEVIDEESTTTLIGSVINPGGETRTDTYETVTTQEIKETTTGLKVEDTNTTKVVGEFVSNIAFQPYIPGTNIKFVALGLRPNLRHYPFFDDVRVFKDVAPAVIENLDFPDIDDLRILSSSRAKGMIMRNGAFGDPLTANSSGGLAGVMRIPARTFFAGERKFVVADVETLSQIKESVSVATAKLNCFNFAIEKGDVVQNTREPVFSNEILGSSTFSSTTSETFTDVVTLGNDDGGGVGANTDPGDGGVDDRLPPCDDIEPPNAALWGPGDLNGDTFDDRDGGLGNRRQPGRLRPCRECPEAFLESLDDRGINAITRHNLRPGLTELEFACARFVDPLAQSFLLQETMFNGSPMGYLKKIDLYFAGKNPSLGCFVEIREVKKGLPTNKILPFGKVAIKAADINVSTDGSLATTVQFKAPVAVETNKEYAFVVKPMANNPETKLWTAKAGQKSITTGEAINQDWGAGSMFLSSNDRTWTPYLDEDAKFTLYACHFNTKAAVVELENDDLEFIKVSSITKGTHKKTDQSGRFVPGEEVFQSATAAQTKTGVTFAVGNNKILSPNTAALDLSTIGVSAGDSIVVKNANNKHDVVQVKTVAASAITIKGSPDITETSESSGSILVVPTGTFEQLESNTNTIMLNDSTAKSGMVFSNGTGNTIIGCDSGASATIDSIEDTNITYHEPRFYNNVPNRTSVTTKLKGLKTDGTSNLTSYERIKTNDRNYPHTAIKIASKSNEISNHSGAKSVKVKHIFSSDNLYAAPFVDLQSQSLLIYENVINNVTTNEYITGQGSAAAKYISRQITLGEGLDAEDLKVFVNAYKPSGTDIKVYAKAINQADEIGFDNGVWSELQAVDNKDKISSSENRADVIEYTFEFKDAPASTVQTGTVRFSDNSADVIGDGTNFDGDFAVGDLVKINNPPFDANTDYQISMVESITDDNNMTLADNLVLGNETDGRQIFKVDAADKNTIFRDPQSNAEDTVNIPQFIATYYNKNNEKLRGYKYLAIKIIMTGTSTSLAPYIQDYRALAVSI